MRRMFSKDSGLGEVYTFQSRKHTATPPKAKQDIVTNIRWCPTHKDARRNKKANEWAMSAVEEPDSLGAEWLWYSDR